MALEACVQVVPLLLRCGVSKDHGGPSSVVPALARQANAFLIPKVKSSTLQLIILVTQSNKLYHEITIQLSTI